MSFHLLLAHSHCPLGNGCTSLRTTINLMPGTVLFTSFQIHICPANLDPAGLSESFLSYPQTPERAGHYRTLLANTKTALVPNPNCATYALSVSTQKRQLLKFPHYLTRPRCLVIWRYEPTATCQQRWRCRARGREIWCVVLSRFAADIWCIIEPHRLSNLTDRFTVSPIKE